MLDRFRVPQARRFDWLDPVRVPLVPPVRRRLPIIWPDPVIPEWRRLWPPDPLGFPPLRPPNGLLRQEVTVPLAPTWAPADTDVYESADGLSSLVLPRYELAFDQVGVLDEPRVRIEERAGVPTMLITLLRTALPPGMGELPHVLSVSLTYRVPELVDVPFPEAVREDGGAVVVAALPLTSPGLRQQLLAAMSSLEAKPAVVVRRGVTVAIPNPMLLIEPPPPQTWTETALLMEWTAPPAPLLLSDAQRMRLGGGAAPGTVQGMRRLRIQHQGRGHPFWQDPARPERFYFLPDRFQLGRLPGSGRRPALDIRATSAAREEDLRVTVEFLARPVVSQERLAAAVPALAEEARRMGSQRPVTMEILADAQPVLRLGLPQGGAAPSALTERPQAQVDLETGVTHAETFTLEDFRLVHAALFGASLNVMNGEVRAGADDIPLELRLDHTAGDVLELTVLSVGAEELAARLVNIVESPVRVDRLEAAAVGGGLRVPLTVGGLPAGKTLAPREEAEITLAPTPLLPDGGAIALDQSGVTVLVDKAAIWASVFDDTAKPSLTREISVEAVPALFGGPGGDRVAVFVVTVEGASGSVRLSETELRAITTVRVPVRPLLVGGPIPPLRYRTETVWQSGGIGVSAWRETDATILLPVKTPPGSTS
ncbi:hypothetical protein OIE66_08910 [Nonomuraea sp. NBC_01738]|uniref:hypothetical protein n=1 Tax=Nonomuraea sp. NBC_01738 TaxID=2976003 RepID=UPI002E0DF85E|nr:hypothetical protein OIE66_08910 [Nonomuraea sp. NBC_01738]